jgi:uncharacterized protein YjbI with pentapeptide repeats
MTTDTTPMTADELNALRERRDTERSHKIWWQASPEEVARAYAADERDFYRANLYGANLYGANLSEADLYGADLSGANLYGANLSGADLSGANLYGANLSGADLYGADLSGANLYGANLSGADLYGADLRGADLSGANLREAKNIWSVYAPGMSSRGDLLYVVDHSTTEEARLMVRMGCWWGDMAAAKERVTSVRGADCAYLLYLNAIEQDWQRQRESETE